MKLDDLTYEIKPLTNSERFEHIVSQLVADASEVGPTYRQGHKEDRQPLPPEVDVSVTSRVSPSFFAVHKGFLRVFAQFSNSMYHIYNNVTKCVEVLIYMSSIIDTFSQALFTRYCLTAVLLYTARDPAVTNDTMHQVVHMLVIKTI